MQDKSRPSPDQRPPLLDFAPVPRKVRRNEGWTPERQRAFIAALADTGSVTAAAKGVNMAHATAYDLYNHPEGAGFRAAWDHALSLGIRQLHDAAMERALGGVAVPIIHGGEQVGEKRVFNDHLLMQLLRHHAGDGCNSPIGRRSQAAREREAAENCPNCREREATDAKAAAEAPGALDAAMERLRQIERRYLFKVEDERRHRLEGDIVAADFVVRQMTSIEIGLVGLGMGSRLLQLWQQPDGPGTPEGVAPPEYLAFAALRQKIWDDRGDPPRPFQPNKVGPTGLGGGPGWEERAAVQRAASARIAEAHAEWEAAASEKSWTAWKARQQALR